MQEQCPILQTCKFIKKFAVRRKFFVIFFIIKILLVSKFVFGFGFGFGASKNSNSKSSYEIIRSERIFSTQNFMKNQTKNFIDEKTDEKNENFSKKCWNSIDSATFSRYSIDLSEPSLEEIRIKFPNLEPGGEWKPLRCDPENHVAIIISFADRPMHLRTLLNNLFHFLQLQEIHFAIYVVEPIPSETFNRGKLMNVGFAEAIKDFNWTCVIFHDVDLIPESLHVSYSCPKENPKHLSAFMNKFKYKLPYKDAFHGVISFTKEQFEKCNGYSNQFWGWGGEDDEIKSRVSLAGFKVERVNESARYIMFKHDKDKMNPVNPCRHNLRHSVEKRWMQDGLNTLNYKVIKKEKQPLFTWIFVDQLEFASKKKLEVEGICP